MAKPDMTVTFTSDSFSKLQTLSEALKADAIEDGKPSKDTKFKLGVDEEFINMIERVSKAEGNEALRQLIGDFARASEELKMLEKQDMQVQEAKEAYNMARETYTSGVKANKNKIAYVHTLLSARGDQVKM